MAKAPFVTIHGIDGTGKTSAARNVAMRLTEFGLPAVTYDDIPPIMAPETAADKDIAKKLSQSALIASYTDSTIAVVRDRWLIDVCADRGFAGREVEVPDQILTPDYSFVLTCQDDTRMQRVLARGNPTEQDLIPNIDGTRAHYFEHYLISHIGAFARQAMVLDTTYSTKEQVADDITASILTSIYNQP